jgi:hypothetical protein
VSFFFKKLGPSKGNLIHGLADLFFFQYCPGAKGLDCRVDSIAYYIQGLIE